MYSTWGVWGGFFFWKCFGVLCVRFCVLCYGFGLGFGVSFRLLVEMNVEYIQGIVDQVNGVIISFCLVSG